MITTSHVRALLDVWGEAWKHPDLWRTAVSTDPDLRVVGQAYLQHLARPSGPLEVLLQLIDEGSFEAAEALLGHTEFREAMAERMGAEDDRVELELERRRIIAQAGVLASTDDFVRRAELVGSPIKHSDPRFDSAYLWAGRDLRRALASLDEIRQTVESAENSYIGILRVRATELSRSEGQRYRPWLATVERALANRDLDVASALVSTGPNDDTVDVTGIAPPPLPPGPFGAKDPQELLDWSLTGHGGSVQFYASWDPITRDSSYRPLLEALDQLRRDKDASEAVGRLVMELNRLLEVEPSAVPRVEVCGNGFVSTLDGVQDEACAAFPVGGIPLYIEPRGSNLSDQLEGDSSLLLLTLNPGESPDRQYPVLRAWDLYRCLARPSDFRANLVRLVCSQVPADRVLPHEEPPEHWAPSLVVVDGKAPSFDAVRTVAERVLEMNGFRAAEAHVLDRIAFYAAERRALLYAYLRALLLELADRALPRSAAITREHVDSAYCRSEFRTVAHRLLIHPIEQDSAVRLVFAATLLVLELAGNRIDASAQADVNDVASWLELEGIALSPQRVRDCLESLSTLDVVEFAPGSSQLRLCRRTGGALMLSLIQDRTAYLNAAKAAYAAS